METEEYNDIVRFLESKGDKQRSWPRGVEESKDKEAKMAYRQKSESFATHDGLLFKLKRRKKPETGALASTRATGARVRDEPQDERYRVAEKIAERYYWKGMTKDVAEYCGTCLVCQRRNKMPKKTASLHPVGVPNRAFAQWGMDLVGPLSGAVVCYLMVLTEYLTKWPETILQDAFHENSDELAEVLPSCVWSDVSTTLKSKLLESVRGHLKHNKYTVPPEKKIMKRVKDYYSNRRSTVLMKADSSKVRKTPLWVKKKPIGSRKLYIQWFLIHDIKLNSSARDKAVKEALQKGDVLPQDTEGIKKLRAAVKPALLDNVQDRDPHAEDVDEETLQASIQKARLNNIAIARAACGAGAKRTARMAQLPDPNPCTSQS
ncbi:hypothetical protein EMCRGX_G014551 [Ephydatia muelleri]